MLRLIKVAAWILVSLGAASFLLVPVSMMTGDPDAAAGFAMFGFLFGVPGGIALWRTIRRERESEFRELVAGMIRSHDRFTPGELATKIGRNELETEKLIHQIADQERLELVFHRSTREYFHRARIREAHRVIDQCGACGGRLSHEMVLEGEAALCQYCGSAV